MRTSRAFTLIEVLIVVAVMALMTATLPRLAIYETKNAWPTINDELNDIAYLARQEAIMHGTMHQLLWHRVDGKDELTVRRLSQDPDDEKKKSFIPLAPGIPSTYKLPDGVVVESVKLEKEDKWLRDAKGVGLVVTPDGLVQTGEVLLARTKRNVTDKVAFTMQAFLGNWKRGEIKLVVA